MSPPAVARDADALRQMCGGRQVVLVPTMGALHDGHLALVHEARRIAGTRANACVCVSVFLNPLQFGPGEDLDTYPRRFEQDLRSLDSLADVCFAPDAKTMYPERQEIMVHAPELGLQLCGAARPSLFSGALTVVAKLFGLTGAQDAVFGEKDYQQLELIRKMVRQLHLPVAIWPVPTVREEDGLAMSSRNAKLAAADRATAAMLHRRLDDARAKIAAGAPAAPACDEASQGLAQDGFEVDYVECRELDLAQRSGAGPNFVVLGAATIGGVRLIDNVIERG